MQRKTRCVIYIILSVFIVLAWVVIDRNTRLFTYCFGVLLNASSAAFSSSRSYSTERVVFDSSTPPQTYTTSSGPPLKEQSELNVLRMNGATQNLSQLNLDSLSYQQLLLTCHSYLDNTNAICKRKLRMGHIGDGGWEVCDDPEVRPRPPCIIYSFGIGNDFSFDDESAAWYKCHVFSFDPTISRDSYNRSSYVHFYNMGIAGRTYTASDGWKYYTFSDIRTILGHRQSRISVIKMDVESSEWDALHHMITSGEMSSVDQFLVEYHISSLTRPYLLKFVSALKRLEQEGFVMFYTHKNEGCGYHVDGFPPTTSRCFEVHYLRRGKHEV